MLLKEFLNVFTWIYKDLKCILPELVQHRILLEIWHFATVLCNRFSVACDTCNWKFA
jgi:hypothetical protein